MLGWLIIVLTGVLSIWGIIYNYPNTRMEEFQREVKGASIVLMIFLLVIISIIYANNRVYAPHRYAQLKQIAREVSSIDTVKELRQFEMEIKGCQDNPFYIFKPIIKIDEYE